jgi:opacity protein-like surface antigen
LASLSTAARAADMPGYPADPLPFPRYEAPAPVEEFVSGWYLRGDLGYRFQRFSSASDAMTSLPDSSLKNVFVGGLGAGYKFSWFRFDLTGDYGGPNTFSGSNASGSHTISANVDTYSVMLNGYVDLGNWWGVTPYLGAGVGGARIETHNLVETPALGTPLAAQHQWNTAWSAMAGVSFNVSPNLLVDVGYRHIDMGSIKGGPTGNQFTVNKVNGDEIRIGLRYLLD